LPKHQTGLFIVSINKGGIDKNHTTESTPCNQQQPIYNKRPHQQQISYTTQLIYNGVQFHERIILQEKT
jgi:hypothetical protein